MPHGMYARIAQRYTTSKEQSFVTKPAEADEALVTAYLALHSLKATLDKFDELPAHLMPYYKQTMKALGLLEPAQREVQQLRGMMRSILR